MINQAIDQLLFIDIETVSAQSKFTELEEEMQELWSKKTAYQRKDEISSEDFYNDKAGIWAEFGKVVCISIGYIKLNGKDMDMRFKSYYGDNEKQLLSEFGQALARFNTFKLIGHNIKEFDIPFLCRRMLIHGLPLPYMLNVAGKKPWEVPHLDTMELWKFGDWKHYTSIKLLTKIFNIPSPKDDIDGSEVGRVYWEEKDFDRIAVYCEKDILAVAQLVLRWTGRDILQNRQIHFSL